MCLANQNALDPKHSMEASVELVDEVLKKMESLLVYFKRKQLIRPVLW
jgi:hypothetical protein